jgi:hypothetical protein
MSLNQTVKTEIKKYLTAIYPTWASQELVDDKRVFIPEGPGGYTMNIQKHRGLTTSTAFMMYLWKDKGAERLRQTIEKHQPVLLGQLFLPGQSFSIQDITQHISCWCNYISAELDGAQFDPTVIEKLLQDLESVLTTKTLERQIFSPVDGVRLISSKDRVDFDSNCTLRKLTDQERSDLLSEDILFSTGRGNIFRHVESVLVQTSTIPIDVKVIAQDTLPVPLPFNHEETYRGVLAAVASIHILKPGAIAIIESRHRYSPNVLPRLDGYATFDAFRPLPFGHLDINDDDLEKLNQIYQGYSSNQNDQLQISIGRLRDAENRVSSVDVLLDCVIGLEVLLNPHDSSELAFRVGLNYAILGEHSDRRKRYQLLRDIQNVRNRIVHGGLNTKSEDAHLIHSNSRAAKDCLREVILKFLMNKEMRIRRKFDAKFWLDKIIPE